MVVIGLMSHRFGYRYFPGWLEAGLHPGLTVSVKLWHASKVREKVRKHIPQADV